VESSQKKNKHMKHISLISGYLFLIIAIITGIAANGYLKTTEGFTKLNPTIFCIVSIVICLFCISKAMTIIPVGFTYATYGALTITAVTLFGVFKYNQTPNTYGTVGILLIIIGVVLLNTLGKLK
jgi:small multidrug resistance pump